MNNNNDMNSNETHIFKKQIGNTVYIVTPYFSKTSKETMSDKIIRLIKQDLESNR